MNDNQRIDLPPPNHKGKVSLEEAISRRRSVRRFTAEPISQQQLSQLLWAVQGTNDRQGRLRTVPSAGATYPLEIFVIFGENCVEGIAGGTYHYNINSHSLELHLPEDTRAELARAALDQKFIHEAPVDIVICAVYERTTELYGNRAERYVHMEIGHAGQNLYLQATALGLATVAVGAFRGKEAGEVLQLKSEIRALYIMPVGKPA